MKSVETMRKLAVVTGGAQGIGLGVALHLWRAGWRVAILDVDREALSELTDWFSGDQWMAVPADVASEDEVASAVGKLGEWQSAAGEPRGVDLLVNNAGIADPGYVPMEELSLVAWNRQISVHLTGTFICSRAFISGLRLRGGTIVNIASTRALQSEIHCEAYAAAKGGVVALTHAMAVSLGPEIRVNVICPGWIETGPWKKRSGRVVTAEHRNVDREQHPVGRVGTVEDIAGAVEYLAGEMSGFVTGQVLVVDGGMTRRMIYEP